MAAELTADQLIDQHRPTLDQALEAIRTRAYWSPHPEHPKAYGEDGSLARPRARPPSTPCCGTRLDLDQPGTDDWTGGEVSPYGIELGVEYPHADIDVLLPAMRRGHARLARRGRRRTARWSAWRSSRGSAPGPTSSRTRSCTPAARPS